MRHVLLISFLALLAGPVRGSESLDHALTLVRGKAYRAANVDWPRVESSAHAIESREGTDAAIRYVLKALGDPHSSYKPPKSSEASGASTGPRLPGPATDIAEVLPREQGKPVLRINAWSGADPATAAQRVRAELVAALSPPSCGLVLDFSNNHGGNMWPMMAGLAPLLSPGGLGSFRSANGEQTRVERRGEALVLGAQTQLSGPTPELRADAAPKWIALVIGPASASSGEITPIMFHGQANVRFFGAATAGLSTANQVFLLPNGGQLVLTTAVTLDRAGRAFPHGLEPDVRSAQPVADAAAWLQAKCHVAPEPTPPREWVDQGVCPFECCAYGRWTAAEDVPVFATPSRRAGPIATVPQGTTLDALTGFVRTRGQTFLVHRAHDRYRPGDKLTVYSYYGEGNFSVWFRGERYTEDLGFSPYGGTGGPRCTDPKHCWGTLQGDLHPQWWIQARLPDGKQVWLDGAQKFDGADRCG